MKNENEIGFTPSPGLPQGTDFSTGTSSAAVGTTTHTEGEGQQAQGGAPLEQARTKVQQLVGTAQERATEQLQSRFETQKHRAADSLNSMARTLRSTSQNLEADNVAGYISQAADRVENLAHYLEDRELNDIISEVEGFARRQPMAFLGGAFALGVLGARFLKSSQPRRGVHAYGDRSGWVRDPERDAVSRPDAPGYVPPSERGATGYQASGPQSM